MFFLKFNVIPSVGKKTMCAFSALFVLCGWLFFQLAYNRPLHKASAAFCWFALLCGLDLFGLNIQ